MRWGSLRLAAGLVAATPIVAVAAAAGCTDGTTPDCSDAQCRVLDAVEGGGDASAAADGPSDDGAFDDARGPGADAGDTKSEIDAGEDAPASTVPADAGSKPDAASDAASNPGDAASHPADAGDSG